MKTTNKITTITMNMNIYNNTDQNVNPNMYIPTKVCSKCRIIKELTEFNKEKTNTDGYLNQCKNCINNRKNEHYELIKDEIYNDITKTKTCNKCNQIKCVTEFHKDKTKYDGYHTQCKTCNNNVKQEYYDKNKDKCLKYQNENRNKDLQNKYRKKYYELNKDKFKEYNKEYRQLNKEKLLELSNAYHNYRINNNPIYRLIKNNCARVHTALKSNNKTAHKIELLSFNKEFFYHWMKWQLPYDMNDDEFRQNYDIDHCRPIATFNLSDPDAQYDAFSWQNANLCSKVKI